MCAANTTRRKYTRIQYFKPPGQEEMVKHMGWVGSGYLELVDQQQLKQVLGRLQESKWISS